MKPWMILFSVVSVLAGLSLASGCSVPHRIVSQDDIASREWNDPWMDKKVLIASRSSEFKDELVKRIEEGVRGDDVYVKVIGVEELKKEEGATYGAVVLVNTCMAWEMDPEIQAFLDRQADTGNVIVLTTSGNGEWTPKKQEMSFDAVTSASEEYDPQSVADGIVEKVKDLLEKARPQ